MADRPSSPTAPTWTANPAMHGASGEAPTWLPGSATQSGTGGAQLTTGHPVSGTDPSRTGRAALVPGTIIDGAYRVEGVIGAGAMGVVYRAHHVRLDRAVALKLQRTVGDDTARLEREARAMARLDHPNVVGVYDVGMHDGDLYIAMEYIDGVSLRAWLAAAPRPWRVALEVCLQAGRGLMAAHAAGIVHRDFKPDNVLVGRDDVGPFGVGRVRVADFGIARGLRSPTPEASFIESNLGPDLTRTGSMPGTPAYMAPEQFEGRADERSDVFAFAVVLYEALWGTRPFGGNSLGELVSNLMQGRIRAVPATSPVPPAVIGAVLGGLAIDPRMRTASMATMLAQLERAKIPRGDSTGVLVAAIVGAVVIAGGLGGAVWWATHRTQAELVASDATPPAIAAPVVEAPAPEEPAEPVAVTPVPIPQQLATPPVVQPPPEDPALEASKRAGKRALVDMMRGKDVDPEALEGLLDADGSEIITATIAGVMMMDADTKVDEGGFRRPNWDGKAKLLCKLGDKFRFENETFALEGTAFHTMYGCQLQLVNCDITADTIVQVMTRSEVTIAGGKLRPRTSVVEQMSGTVAISGVEVLGTPEIGFQIMGGTLVVADTTVSAGTGLAASADARVTLVGGRIEGGKTAIKAASGAQVTLDQTEVVGPVVEQSRGTIGAAAEKH